MSDLAGDAPQPEPFARPVVRPTFVERVREWVAWFGVGRLIAGSFAVLAVGAGGFWLLRTPPAPVEARLPMTATSTPPAPPAAGGGGGAAGPTTIAPGAARAADSTAPPSTLPADIVVHVAGAVVVPGVYRMAPTARVVDAVAAAGGPAPGADADALNQAQVLHDGDRVYVPRADEAIAVPAGVSGTASAGGGAPASSAPPGPIDLNRANAEELDALPGVGPATAAAIVSYRDTHGPFASVDDLADVRGIGPAKLDALRGLVTT